MVVMMDESPLASIDRLSVENFRSISGLVTLPLDAPIVLLHGANGVGKTSLLAALELALTGEIASMKRVERRYVEHLVHQGANQSSIILSGQDEGAGSEPYSHTIRVKDKKIHGNPLLDQLTAQFFSERCYLGQSVLSRLLEIYQSADTGSDSPLTRFVKDLLGLDQIEAIIDGLTETRDRRLIKNLVPDLRTLDDDRKHYDSELKRLVASFDSLTEKHETERSRFEELLVNLPDEVKPESPPTQNLETLGNLLAQPFGQADLTQILQIDRELLSIRNEWIEKRNPRLSIEREEAERNLETTTRLADDWKIGTGEDLSRRLVNLQKIFPDLPSWESTSPQIAYETVVERSKLQAERLSARLTNNRRRREALTESEQKLRQTHARSRELDRRISRISKEVGALGAALAGIVPHIHTDDCPICGRDFSEISDVPLFEFTQEKVTKLGEQSSLLSDLLGERTALVSTISNLEESLGKRAWASVEF